MGRTTGSWRCPATLVATLAVTAGMATAAVLTVLDAGCPDPGRLVVGADGVVELVGGCVRAGDLVVPGAPLTTLDGRRDASAVRP